MKSIGLLVEELSLTDTQLIKEILDLGYHCLIITPEDYFGDTSFHSTDVTVFKCKFDVNNLYNLLSNRTDLSALFSFYEAHIKTCSIVSRLLGLHGPNPEELNFIQSKSKVSEVLRSYDLPVHDSFDEIHRNIKTFAISYLVVAWKGQSDILCSYDHYKNSDGQTTGVNVPTIYRDGGVRGEDLARKAIDSLSYDFGLAEVTIRIDSNGDSIQNLTLGCQNAYLFMLSEKLTGVNVLRELIKMYLGCTPQFNLFWDPDLSLSLHPYENNTFDFYEMARNQISEPRLLMRSIRKGTLHQTIFRTTDLFKEEEALIK